MDSRVRKDYYGTGQTTTKRPVTAPAYGQRSGDKHELLRNRVESQLRARINETKKRSTSRSSSSHTQSHGLSESYFGREKPSSLRQTRLREMLEAYSFAGANRNKSANSRSPPPVLRRRLTRPGRPIVTTAPAREEDPESSESPVNFRRIHRRLMPPRPTSVSMIQRHQDTSSLNSTFNAKSQSLRSRLADLSQTMRIIEDKSNSVSPPPKSRQRRPADTMKLIEDIRRRAAEISRTSSMCVDESNMPSIVIPREAPDTPVQLSRDTFVPLNHMSRSIRDLHPSSPRAVSPANWIRDHHSSLLVSSPSPSASSIGFVEGESEAFSRRKEQARAELDRKQRELADTLVGHSDYAVMSLESLNVVGSSVRSLSDLIRAKEAEIEAKKSAYISRKSEHELKQKQLEYLKQLEEEEAKIEMDTLALSDCSLPIPEEVSVPPLPSPPPVTASGKRTPEIFSISSPVRHVDDLSPVSDVLVSVPIPIPDQVYETLGIDEMILEPSPDDELMADLMMSPLDDSSSAHNQQLEDISDNIKDVSLPLVEVLVVDESGMSENLSVEPEPVLSRQPLLGGEPEGVFTLSLEEDRCHKMNEACEEDPCGRISAPCDDAPCEKISGSCDDDITTTVPSDIDELAELVVSSLIDSIISEHFVELETLTQPACVPPPLQPTPRINTRIDSFDIVDSSSLLENSAQYLNSPMIVKAVIGAITGQIWVKTDEELSDVHLNHIRTMIDFEDVLSSVVSNSSVAVCLADAFLVLVDSSPPSMAAEREWQVRFPGSHSPMASFLPSRHTISSLTKSFESLIHSYNKSVASDQDIAQVENFLCHEYLKKSRCDEILFQCNDSDMWTRFDSNTCSRAETEIVDEVSLFVLEAIITSVAADFQT